MFTCYRFDHTQTAYRYLCGLIQSERRNMERMEEAVVGVDYEVMQHFISDSSWDARAVMDRVAQQADGLLGGTGRTALILDETAIAKKGRASVGVARQYNGRLGKVDNSQVAVCGALSAGDRAVLVDMALFLPEEWIQNPARCEKVGVPPEEIRHRTKPELAIEIVRRQRQAGIRFDYVLADGLYGHSGDFCRALSHDGETFLVHVHSNQQVYLEDPRPALPVRSTGRGRPAAKPRAQSEPVRVDALSLHRSPEEFQRVRVRETSTGGLDVDAYRRLVYVWDGKEETARRMTLYIRRDVASSSEIKYCLTNALGDTPLEALAYMEAQRYFIEQAFGDAKGQVGMAQYQVRGWMAWHHHMALVMMAMLFLTKQRMLHQGEDSWFSCRDIKLFLAYFLPKRQISFQEILRQMEVRHKKRRTASKNVARRKRKENEANIMPFNLPK
jgi:SRSO17 transposase